MWGLDTSVVVRLLVGEPADQAEAARALLYEEREQGVAVSDLVIGEAYFALRYHYRVPHQAAIGALRGLLADPRVNATGVGRSVLASVGDRGGVPGLMDRLIHADYRREASGMVTFDRAAGRLEGARLLQG
jgi:predicted nucleic acid-binding protein